MSVRRQLGAIVYGHPVYRAVRDSAPAQALLDYAPRRATFFDGSTRLVPRQLARLIKHWRTHVGRYEESCQSYYAYGGGDVLDIGAFHGWYSVLLAPKASQGDTFVSIEPNPKAFPTLLSTLSFVAKLFPTLVTYALPIAIGDGGAMTVTFPHGRQGHPRFASAADATEGATPTMTVDSLVCTLNLRPSYIKVDVEGAEYFVLRGMQETLARFGPRVLLEVHPRWQPADVTVAQVEALLARNGYTKVEVDVTDLAIRQLWTYGSH
jgi:FkbM family methyltransferase